MSANDDKGGSGSSLENYLKNQSEAGSAGPAQKGAGSFGLPRDPASGGLNLNLSTENSGALEPGGFWRRFAATFIDGIILSVMRSVVLIPLAMVMGISQRPGATNGLAQVLILQLLNIVVIIVFAYFYYGWFYANKGASPGKMVLGLKVVDATKGTHIGYGKAVLRETIGKFLSGIILGIGFFMAAFTDRKQALHDMIAGTRVVRVKNPQ